MVATLCPSSNHGADLISELRLHYGVTESGNRSEALRPTVFKYNGMLASGSTKVLFTAFLAASLYANSTTRVMCDESAATTSNAREVRVQAAAYPEPLVAAIPESAQVTYLLDNLISNRSALADILGISRTALYDWKAGKPVSSENSAHLNRITACVQQVAFGRTVKLYHRYVSEHILVKTLPLADLLKNLKSAQFDQSSVLALLAKAWEMSEVREAKDRALDQRLAGKGFSELTDEQRRANAEHNRVMQDLQRGERG